MKPLTETATEMWHELATHHDDPYETKKARIFAISAEGFSRVLVTSGDVYDALDLAGGKTLNADEIGIGVETCGWAAPIQDEDDKKAKRENKLQPSQHPQRRRCRLITLVNKDLEAGSALGFSDEDEIITDEGKAKGSLADALITAITKLTSKNN
jgi:hypothetical protein